MTTQDNNEAASAPGLQSRINAELAKVFKDDPANACRAHAAITAVLAASASQSSTAGAAKGGNTCPHCGTHEVELSRTCHNSDCTSYAAAETIYEGWRKSSSHIAHVARQRQESTSEYSQVSSEHSAAVAEGVDTPEFRELLGSYVQAACDLSEASKGRRVKLLAHIETTYGAQQREAGRREERATIGKETFDLAVMWQARAEKAEAALQKINAIRNSIIGIQTINWSEHVYPLVAALDEAGYEGMEYPEAREYFGTLLERAVKAEDQLAALARQPVSEGQRELGETIAYAITAYKKSVEVGKIFTVTPSDANGYMAMFIAKAIEHHRLVIDAGKKYGLDEHDAKLANRILSAAKSAVSWLDHANCCNLPDDGEMGSMRADMNTLRDLVWPVSTFSAVPPAKAEGMSEKLEGIAESWDGCMYEAVGETLDIGASLRNQFAAILAQQAKGEKK